MIPVESNRWKSIAAEFAPRQLPFTVGTGLVLAMVNTLLSVALVSLIFSGNLRGALPIGIGLGLVGSATVALSIGLGSSFPGMYAGIQDASAAIVSLSAAAIVTSVPGSDGVTTVLALIAVTSFATGLTFLALGYFRWGEIARFVPFPVVGGLLAGTGFLIVTGAMDLLGMETFAGLSSALTWGLTWPGLVLSALFLVASRRGWPTWSYVAVLGGGMVAFHISIALAGIDTGDALARGWLLGPVPQGQLWPGLVTQSLANADWTAIASQAASLAAILVIAPISVLLYLSAIEIETKRDLDITTDLRATGWANVASAAVGGAPGYMYLADTVMTYRVVGPRRGATVVAALTILLVVVMGGSVLELIPQFIVGGILLFFGFEFLVEWLWTMRKKMGRLDYVLMFGIVIVIATVGFLEGVATGLLAATALFVVRYSRIDVVKHSLTASEHQSNIERPLPQAQYLREAGGSVLVLELQGFIFFGTAGRIIGRLRDRLRESEPLLFVIFDFRRVTGVDSSAVALFERIGVMARERDLVVLLTDLDSTQTAQFSELVSEYGDVITVEPDLDRGMAWCEDRLLDSAGADRSDPRALPEGLEAELGRYLVARSIAAGERLMTQGEPAPGIYLLKHGRATVLLEGGDEGGPVRLRTILEGTVLGEISLYRGEPVTATVMAETECEVLHLSPEAFDELCRDDPSTAADLHAFVARTLAARVSHANRAIRALRG